MIPWSILDIMDEHQAAFEAWLLSCGPVPAANDNPVRKPNIYEGWQE